MMNDVYSVFPVRKGQFEYFDYLLPEHIKDIDYMQYAGAVNSKGYPSGILAYTTGIEKTNIEFIGVVQKERRKGAARTLIRALMAMLKGSGIDVPLELMWSEEDNDRIGPLIAQFPDFYISKDDSVLNVRYEDLMSSPVCKKIMSVHKKTQDFFKLSPIEKKWALNALRNKKMEGYLRTEKEYLEDLCICVMSEDDISETKNLDALVMFENGDGQDLILSFLYVSEKAPMAMGVVLGEALQRIEAGYKGMGVSMNLINQKSRELAEGIFGKDLSCEKLYTAISFGRT